MQTVEIRLFAYILKRIYTLCHRPLGKAITNKKHGILPLQQPIKNGIRSLSAFNMFPPYCFTLPLLPPLFSSHIFGICLFSHTFSDFYANCAYIILYLKSFLSKILFGPFLF